MSTQVETGADMEEGLEDGTGEGEESLEALIAAGEAAASAAGGIEEPEKPAPPKKAPAVAEEPKPNSSAIAQELARREAKRSVESEYQGKLAEANAAIQRAEQAHHGLVAQQQKVAALQQELERAKADPLAFMQAAGWDPDTFINEAMRRKDPNFRAQQSEFSSELQKRDAVIAELRAGLAELQGVKKGYDQEREQVEAQQRTQEFWASIPKDSPVLQEDEQDVIIYKANKVAEEYKKKTGRVATPTQIGEYLHYQALQRRQGATAQSAELKAPAGKPKAKVPRALGSSSTSGRSGGQVKDIRDMNPAEERDYLITVAGQAVSGE